MVASQVNLSVPVGVETVQMPDLDRARLQSTLEITEVKVIILKAASSEGSLAGAEERLRQVAQRAGVNLGHLGITTHSIYGSDRRSNQNGAPNLVDSSRDPSHLSARSANDSETSVTSTYIDGYKVEAIGTEQKNGQPKIAELKQKNAESTIISVTNTATDGELVPNRSATAGTFRSNNPLDLTKLGQLGATIAASLQSRMETAHRDGTSLVNSSAYYDATTDDVPRSRILDLNGATNPSNIPQNTISLFDRRDANLEPIPA